VTEKMKSNFNAETFPFKKDAKWGKDTSGAISLHSKTVQELSSVQRNSQASSIKVFDESPIKINAYEMAQNFMKN
jgi:hypothetical protein